MDKSFNYIDSLCYRINPDGSVDLEQDLGAGNVERVFLHRVHLRLLLEETAHLLPLPPADDLAKRLAVQLCELRDGLALEFGRSPGIDALSLQATAACDMLPDAIYPNWLYSDQDEKPIEKEKPKAAIQPEFQLQPSPRGEP